MKSLLSILLGVGIGVVFLLVFPLLHSQDKGHDHIIPFYQMSATGTTRVIKNPGYRVCLERKNDDVICRDFDSELNPISLIEKY